MVLTLSVYRVTFIGERAGEVPLFFEFGYVIRKRLVRVTWYVLRGNSEIRDSRIVKAEMQRLEASNGKDCLAFIFYQDLASRIRFFQLIQLSKLPKLSNSLNYNPVSRIIHFPICSTIPHQVLPK